MASRGVKTRAKLFHDDVINWNAIQHFEQSEFACKCGCGFDDINLKIVLILEKIRADNGNHPLIVTSGCRCIKHNKKVGGIQGSKHLKGDACDFYIPRNINTKFIELLHEINGKWYYKIYIYK